MALAHSPKIVSDQLVFCMDPSNTKSYSGSGNNIDDLTNTIGTFLKTTQVDFAGSGSQKYFNFDYNLSTDSITVPHNSVLNYDYANWSYNLWFNRESADQSGWQQLFIKGSGHARRPGVWFHNNDTTMLHITWKATSGTTQQTINTTFDIPIGEWCNVVIQARAGTMMSFLNGKKDAGTLTLNNYATNSSPLYICGGAGYNSPNMQLGYFSVYNTSLTDEQVMKNYNALKGRFGL